VDLPPLDTFARAVLVSRLIARPRLQHRLQEFRGDPRCPERSAKGFAQFLLARGELTVYQAERLLAGRTEGFFLGDFKILERLGAGAMGRVYVAEQLKLGRQIALKTLREEHAGDENYVARFQREARAAAQLKHPNIVQIYDVGQQGRTHYIVMELVRGRNLKDLLKDQGPLPVDQSLDVICQTAQGLEHAHERGIVHRDVKPSNLVLEGRTVKILDLGLARRFESGETMTQEGKALGTPDYMSPEQFRDARRADVRSDIYSLGCTWYALLAGRPPFVEADPVGKALAHETQAPQPIQNLAPAVPEWVARTVHKMLAKSPDERYPSCRELLADIERHGATGPTPRLGTTAEWPAPRAAATPPAAATQAASRPALEAAHATDADTLVERRTTTVPMVLVYVLPVMAALVLGGVYFGVKFLREQLPEAEPIVVDVAAPIQSAAQKPPAQGASRGSEPLSPKPGAPAGVEGGSKTTRQAAPPPREPSKDKAQESAARLDKAPPPDSPRLPEKKKDHAPAEKPAPTPLEPPPAEKHTATVWRVGTAEGMIGDLPSAWNQSGDGDRIELASAAPMRVGPLEAKGKHLRLLGAVKSGLRPIVVFEPPPEPKAGRGLWRVVGGGLDAEGIDFYIDMTDRPAADSDLALFQMVESDFRLVDSTITVVTGTLESRSPVTAIKCQGERPWDKKAAGDAPRAVQVEVRNSMIRGPLTTVYVQSRQTVVRVENSIVCSPGTLVHVFHTQPVALAQHRLSLEVGACTLDLAGPLIAVSARPYDLPATPLYVTMRSTILASASQTARPPQIFWESPIDGERVSGAVRWTAASNCYFQRGDGLQAKSPAGPLVTFVEGPADWQRLGLGQETGWFTPPALRLPAVSWHKRSPSDYSLYGTPARAKPRAAANPGGQLGADTKRVAQPRRLSTR
jgi:serine/threonine-protein kinase